MTLGEKRVRVEFNPDNNDLVHQFKQKSAELINLFRNIPTRPDDKGEQQRLISLGMTAYEEAAMWAVKAVTF